MYPVSLSSFARLKLICWPMCPEIKSSHLSEILAAGFGFSTHAALRSRASDIPVELEWDDESAASRAGSLQSAALPQRVVEHPLVTMLGVLKYINVWQLERLAGKEIQSTDDHLKSKPLGGLADAAAHPASTDGPGRSRRDLYQMVLAFSQEQLWEVQAVMWIERELHPNDDSWRLQPLFEYARDSHDEGSYGYVASKLGLGKYLRMGLDALAKRCTTEKFLILGTKCRSCDCGLVHIRLTDEVICPGCWCWGTYQDVIVQGGWLGQPGPVSAKVKRAISEALTASACDK
jgi:hypothetical protein